MAVIGLDIGTSGVKSTLFENDAHKIGHAYREYNLIGGDGRYELDPRVLWAKTKEVLAESVHGYGGSVDAICFTSMGESFVCLDEKDQILCNTMIYMDPRGEEECEEFRARHGELETMCHSGQTIDKMYAMYKLRWMHKHMQKVVGRIRRICFIADFMAYLLGAEHKCDYSLAARSGMFDVFQKKWIDDCIAFSGLNPAALPEPVPSGSIVGEVSAEMAKKLGIRGRTKLILGGHDQVLAAAGSGAWESGDVANGMGTVDCIQVVLSEENIDFRQMQKYSFAFLPYLDSGNYLAYPFNMSCGCTVKWFRDTFAKDFCDQEDAYVRLNAEAPNEPTGLMVLPYFAGSGTPYMDSNTPAAIAGLRLGTSRGKIFRAFLEGESYEMMVNIECVERLGTKVNRITSVGGGTNSPLWMQLRADIFNRPVQLPAIKEAGTFASAILCLVGIGAYKSVNEAQRALIRYDEIYTPRPQTHEKYQLYYEQYKQFSDMMRKFYAK